MSSHQTPASALSHAGRIISRFAQILSAQGVEGVGSTAFFLFLAWWDSTLYGQVMYALAGGAIVMKVVQYGFYYQLVYDLGEADRLQTGPIIAMVNAAKVALLAASMACVIALALYRDLSAQTALIFVSVSLGFGLEGISESFFADLRVRGQQKTEARIKIVAAFASYGFGLATAAAGLNPVVVGLFKLLSGFICVGAGLWVCAQACGAGLFERPAWKAVRGVVAASSVFALVNILGIVYNKTNIFFLESSTGVRGVALYSAAWNLVDPISILASEQLLGWVVFPFLSALWWNNRDEVTPLVRRTAQWLMALAFPIMFVLHVGSDLLIGLVYPSDYRDAAWMQQYLVWTVLLSFENNLFSYVMIVAGAQRLLLGFTVITTAANLVFNVALVEPFGLAGGCLVIILTKLVMTTMVITYCQLRFRMLGRSDFVYPIGCACLGVAGFWLLSPLMGVYPAAALVLGLYLVGLWKPGDRFLGRLPRTQR